MSRNLKLVLAPLAALLLAASSGYSQQSPKPASPPAAAKSKSEKTRQTRRAPVSELIARILTEEARLDTARRLSAMATTSQEKRLAQKAVRLADHELDLAFFVALRRAADNQVPDSPQLSELDAAVKSHQADVDNETAVVDQLKKQAAGAHGRKKEAIDSQLEMEQAKLELANDELTAAREDLINAGGDLRSQIERLQAEHNAADQAAAQTASNAAAAAPAASESTSNTLLDHLKQWMALYSLRSQLDAAQDDATSGVDILRERMGAVEKDAAGTAPAASPLPAPPAPPASKRAPAKAPADTSALELLKRQSRTQKILAGFKLRIHDMTELAATYERWNELVAARQKQATWSLIFSALWMVLIVLVGIIANRLSRRVFDRMTTDRRRLHTLRTLSRFGVQVFCLALILLVVLGPPSQLATLVAFAGAGLTVALKDFIVSFIGWFMLMGKNGVHAGDWVEINNVCGEVIEVSLFHTVMLETGAWNDPGHPTGRKVTFNNAYAIEGHYFNFTTSGQWLWDELEFLIPPGQDPNAVAESVMQMVTTETQANAKLAEEEWTRLSSKKAEVPAAAGAPAVSAAPVLSVRTSAMGVAGRVRYITRANERFQTRTRLYHLIVEALHARSAHP